MPLKRKVIRRNNEIIIEDRDETEKTEKTVLIIPQQVFLVCDKCGESLNFGGNEPTTIICSNCGCPSFHTSMEFAVQCVNCDNIVNVKEKFNGHCAKCKQRMWKTV